MSGLKKHYPDIRFSGNQVTPDEIDAYNQYCVIKPSITLALGTVDPGTVSAAFVIDRDQPDYPRNLKVTAPGANDYGGTATIVGKNFFGEAVSETFAIGTATNGGTTAGSVVFASVTSGTWVHGGGDNQGTVSLLVASGTASGDTTVKFGLPVKLGGTTDIKAINWIDNGAGTAIDTPSSQADTGQHAFKPTANVAAADDYVVTVKSTYDATDDPEVAGL